VNTVTTTEAKARLHALLDDVAAGDSVTITRHGRAVAVLTAPGDTARHFGLLAGVVSAPADFDDPLDDEELALWDGRP